MKTKFWGCPFHGKTEDGVLTVSGTPSSRNHGQLAIQSPREWAGQTSIPVKNPYVTLPSLTRDTQQQANDAAIGAVWKDYGLLSGTYKSLYGGPASIGTHPYSFEVGFAGWLYISPNGQVWRCWIYEFETTERGGQFLTHEFKNDTYNITIKVQRFGFTPAHTAAAATVYTLNKSLGYVDFPYAMPSFSDDSRVAIGTQSLDGSKVVFQSIHQNAINPPADNNGYGNGWGYFTSYLMPTFECWKVTCTGTPGVDFDVTITPYFNSWVVAPLDNQTLTSGEIRIVHCWVTPGGTFQDITVERELVSTGPDTWQQHIHTPNGTISDLPDTDASGAMIPHRISGPNSIIVSTRKAGLSPWANPSDWNWYLATTQGNIQLNTPSFPGAGRLDSATDYPKGVIDGGDAATVTADAFCWEFTRQCYV